MIAARLRAAAVVLLAVLAVVWATAQQHGETFTATASVRNGTATLSVPVTITVTRYAAAGEAAAATAALRDGGTAALQATLAAAADAGFVQVGERRTPIKFAGVRPTGAGRLVTIVTAQPIAFLGAGLPAAKPTAGFAVAVALLDVREGAPGLGELAPAARVGLDDGGALVIEDYGSVVVWLQGLSSGR